MRLCRCDASRAPLLREWDCLFHEEDKQVYFYLYVSLSFYRMGVLFFLHRSMCQWRSCSIRRTQRVCFTRLPNYLSALVITRRNRFLRWKAIQDASFIDPADGKEKIWSESNVSEDFDMALRLLQKGYIIRCGTLHFLSGVRLSYEVNMVVLIVGTVVQVGDLLQRRLQGRCVTQCGRRA